MDSFHSIARKTTISECKQFSGIDQIFEYGSFVNAFNQSEGGSNPFFFIRRLPFHSSANLLVVKYSREKTLGGGQACQHSMTMTMPIVQQTKQNTVRKNLLISNCRIDTDSNRAIWLTSLFHFAYCAHAISMVAFWFWVFRKFHQIYKPIQKSSQPMSARN